MCFMFNTGEPVAKCSAQTIRCCSLVSSGHLELVPSYYLEGMLCWSQCFMLPGLCKVLVSLLSAWTLVMLKGFLWKVSFGAGIL